MTQDQLLPTPPPLTPPSLSPSLPLLYKMSQPDYTTIIKWLQEQIMTLLEQVAAREGRGTMNLEVAKPQMFDGIPSKVSGFVTACKLYGKRKMREMLLVEQIQWVLSYV